MPKQTPEKPKEERTEFEKWILRAAGICLALGAIGSAVTWAGSTAFVTKAVFADHEKRDVVNIGEVLTEIRADRAARKEERSFDCAKDNKGSDYFVMCVNVGKKQ